MICFIRAGSAPSANTAFPKASKAAWASGVSSRRLAAISRLIGGYIESDMGCLRSIVHPAEPMQALGRHSQKVNDRAPERSPALVDEEAQASPILEERQVTAVGLLIGPALAQTRDSHKELHLRGLQLQ